MVRLGGLEHALLLFEKLLEHGDVSWLLLLLWDLRVAFELHLKLCDLGTYLLIHDFLSVDSLLDDSLTILQLLVYAAERGALQLHCLFFHALRDDLLLADQDFELAFLLGELRAPLLLLSL